MRKLLLALALLCFASPALAQNTQCSDRTAADSSNACANTRFVQTHAILPGSITLGQNHILVGSVSGFAADVAMSGDCSILASGAITCTKTNNVAFAASATTDTTNATNIASGTLANARLVGVQNTVKGAATSAVETDLAVPSCSTASSVLQWTTNTGFGCGSFTPGTNIQTTNYTIATSDCNKTVQIGTGSTGFGTFTLPAPAGFAEGCLVTIKNGDTTRGKGLSGFPTGFTQGHGILWPTQSGAVQVVNSVWTSVRRPGRAKLESGTFSLFSDFTNGTDNFGLTDCMASGASACKALENAMYMSCAEFDFNPLAQTLLVINVAGNINDTQGVHYACSNIPGGQGGAFIQIVCGSNGTINTTNTDAFDIVTNAVVFTSGCTFQASGTVGGVRNADCVRADYGGQVFFGGGTVVACTGSQFAAENGGRIILQSNYNVNSNATNHFFVSSGGVITTDTNTIVATLGANVTLTNWASAESGGVIRVPNWTVNLNTHTATDKRELTTGTGTIDTKAGLAACTNTYFPGNVNGATVAPFCN